MANVRVENVSVSFPIYDSAGRSLKQRLLSGAGGRIRSDAHHRICIEALRNISFTLAHGDRVALIGHNGAGKTTLLRVLAGIYTPVSGRVLVSGRIAPLFDVNLGMDSDATGYENIRIRGLYLGLLKSQIEERLDEIAEFTELGPFLDMPIRTYSLGMHTRLAFAIATSIDPEVLLLDEGIGAGDAAFIEKANTRLNAFIERAGIMVLASHSEDLIHRFCNKAILIEHGELVFAGEAREALDIYRERNASQAAS